MINVSCQLESIYTHLRDKTPVTPEIISSKVSFESVCKYLEEAKLNQMRTHLTEKGIPGKCQTVLP